MTSRIFAWLLLAAILYVTVSPIEFRPMTNEPPNVERLWAFAAAGFLFALGYPRRLWLVFAIIVGTAFAFEAAQLLVPSRHAHLADALVKSVGGGLGLVAGYVVNRALARLLPS